MLIVYTSSVLRPISTLQCSCLPISPPDDFLTAFFVHNHSNSICISISPCMQHLKPRSTALAPFLFVSLTTITKSCLLLISSTTSTLFPVIVPTLRWANRTSHERPCRLFDPQIFADYLLTPESHRVAVANLVITK